MNTCNFVANEHPHQHADNSAPTATNMNTAHQSHRFHHHHTADLNACAVSRLQEGDINTCILIIKHELANVRANLMHGDDHHHDQEMYDDEIYCPILRSVSITAAPSTKTATTTTPHFHDDDCNNLFSFYPRAFVMEHVQQKDTRFLVVLLYNLALAYQVHAASSCGGSEQQSLAQALRLYKSAMEIANSSWEDEDFEELRCLLLAILNNIGFISSQQMDFAEACNSIRMMCDLINHYESSSASATIPEADFELFFQSVFTYLDGSELVVAPAA